MSELEAREVQFNVVQDRGEALVMDRHPAAKTIEVTHQSYNRSNLTNKLERNYVLCVLLL